MCLGQGDHICKPQMVSPLMQLMRRRLENTQGRVGRARRWALMTLVPPVATGVPMHGVLA